MAQRRNTIVARKKKNYTKTKSQKDFERVAIKIAIGNEIEDEDLPRLQNDPVFYAETLHWYNQIVDITEAREFLESFLLSINNKHHDAITRVPNAWINLTSCWIARLLSRGAKLPDSAVRFFKAKLIDMAAKSDTRQDETAEPVLRYRPSVQENIRSKAGDLIFEIEQNIDKGLIEQEFDAQKWLKDQQVSSAVAQKISDKFVPIAEELQSARNQEAPDLVEAYRHMTRKQLDHSIKFYLSIVDAANVTAQNKPVVIRKSRPVDPKKKVSKIRPMKEQFGVQSLDPIKILSANELWVYNSTRNTITVYRAESSVLDVRRTTLLGYDKRTTVSKKLGRSSEELVKSVPKSSKAQLRRMIEGLKTNAPVLDRINDKTMLLRVF